MRPSHRRPSAQRGFPLRHAVAGAAALLMAGCSLQPVYQRPELPVAPHFPVGSAYDQAGGSPDQRPAVEIGWREFLGDPRLQRLVEVALANNRDLRVSALTVAQVQAQYRIQRAALAPQVGVAADGSASRTPGSLSPSRAPVVQHAYSVEATIAWEIDFFGRLRSLSDAALQQYFASAEARKAFEILLVSQVANQYLAVLAFDELIRVTDLTLETAQASFDLTRRQLEAGTGNELALRQAQTVVQQAKANRAAQVRGRAQAENGLVLLLGQTLPADLPPPVALGDQQILADIPEGLPSDLLTRRPDVIQAEAQLRGANANIGAARAAFFPTISLTGALGTASSSLGGLFKGGAGAWSFLPSITLPIFNGGQLQANLDVATLQKDINVAQYEKAIQTAFSEVADGLAARGTYGEELAATESTVEAEQRALDLSQQLFRNGVASYLTVLTAQNGLYSAQTTLVSTRLARLTNLVDLYRALGGGWIEHTGEVPRPADVDGRGQASVVTGVRKPRRGKMSNSTDENGFSQRRRNVIAGGVASIAALSLPLAGIPTLSQAQPGPSSPSHHPGASTMTQSYVTTKDGVQIFYKDWGPATATPIVFSHGWPLSADDWDAQMMFFLSKGFRVIAHDRRGHGRSSQVWDGHDMDHYADDLAAVVTHLDLKGAIHVGHSTGGGEVVRYLARHGEKRASKACLIAAVPPLMVKTASNPGGLPKDVFDGLQAQTANNRAQFFRDIPAGPFYGFNRPGVKAQEGVIENWWRQGMMGSAKAHYDGIVAFSQTDFTEDLKKIGLPVLVMHGDDDQIVPYADAGPLSAKLLKNGTLKTYKGFPHGMPTTQAEVINADLLAFIKG